MQVQYITKHAKACKRNRLTLLPLRGMFFSYTHTHKIEPYPEVFLLTSSSAPPLFLASLPIPFSLTQVETLSKQTANNGGKLCTFEGSLSVTNIRVIDL